MRRPRVGRMRPIWRVIAAITPMRRPHASAAMQPTMHQPLVIFVKSFIEQRREQSVVACRGNTKSAYTSNDLNPNLRGKE